MLLGGRAEKDHTGRSMNPTYLYRKGAPGEHCIHSCCSTRSDFIQLLLLHTTFNQLHRGTWYSSSPQHTLCVKAHGHNMSSTSNTTDAQAFSDQLQQLVKSTKCPSAATAHCTQPLRTAAIACKRSNLFTVDDHSIWIRNIK